MDTGKQKGKQAWGEADHLALNTAHVSCLWDKPTEGSSWLLDKMEEIPTCLELGSMWEKLQIVLTFALRPLGVH